jgi:2-keto-4-pentenoate hydratase/2-oxohepta-3-ene-1,7-dioic acid hydratase in catechol pathway
MRSTKLITARVPPETKAKFQALAESYSLNESRFMRSLIDRAVDVVREPGAESVRKPQEESRAERLYVRLYPDDRLLLAERATARGMPAATYIAVLARAHLRHLSPLPETERKAFERGVAELAAIGRNLNQIARHLNQGGALAIPRPENLALFIKVCTAAVGHFKATLKANKTSWEVGYESTDR